MMEHERLDQFKRATYQTLTEHRGSSKQPFVNIPVEL